MTSKLGVYIHFPYCEKKCPYCDFNSHVANSIDHHAFLDAYIKDFNFYISKIDLSKKRNLESIFFGGGTPSLMEPFVVNDIIEYIKCGCSEIGIDIMPNLEVTLEANPSSFEVDKFQDFRNAGINRVSIGVQSFIEDDLKQLGRIHDKAQAINAINTAKKIFDRFSFDLMYARKGQSLFSWEQELEFGLREFSPSHTSLYGLTIEKGTEFFRLYKNGMLQLPENQDEFYDKTNDICQKYGLERYEVSNYARKGEECRHNILYWTGQEYIGIGPGAHGRIETSKGRIATMNYNSPQKYLQSMKQHENAVQIFDVVNMESYAMEAVAMGLRTIYGIVIDERVEKYISREKVEDLIRDGILVHEGIVIKPTKQGINIADAIGKYIIR